MKPEKRSGRRPVGFGTSAFCLLVCFALSGCRDASSELLAGEMSAQESGQDPGTREPASARTAGETVGEAEQMSVFVDVEGAVRYPGVYELDAGSRIYQAIDAAGGFTADAGVREVNQAQILQDGQQLYIPFLTQEFGGDEAAAASAQNISAGAPGGSSGGESAAGKVNINTADETQLRTLSGIGAVKAQAIIQYREANGAFGAVEDIQKVSGIGAAIFEKIRDQIAVQ